MYYIYIFARYLHFQAIFFKHECVKVYTKYWHSSDIHYYALILCTRINVSALLAEAARYEDVPLDAVWTSSDRSQAVVGSSYRAEHNPAAVKTSWMKQNYCKNGQGDLTLIFCVGFLANCVIKYLLTINLNRQKKL